MILNPSDQLIGIRRLQTVREQLFWYKFKINDRGKGELYFPDPVFHMFDFLGKGAEEVITLSRRMLRVYGSKHARYTTKDAKKNLLYLKTRLSIILIIK